MPYHRFKVGQTAVAPSGGPGEVIPGGPLVIVRLLPLVDGEPQYRVRSEADGHEPVGLCPTVFARYGDARRMDDVHLNATNPQRFCHVSRRLQRIAWSDSSDYASCMMPIAMRAWWRK
jgi:hypothetical protein